MIIDRDETGAAVRMIFNPGEPLLPALDKWNDEEFRAQFASYAKTMTKSDLADKLVLPAYAARTLDDFISLNPLTVYAKKQVELRWEVGDPLKVSLVSRLTGSGVTDGTALDGAEEELTITQKSFTINEYAHGVPWTALAGKTSRYSIEEIARAALSEWARRKLESLLWAQIKGAGLTEIYVNDRGSEGALQAGDKLDTSTIQKAVSTLRKNKVPGFTAKDVDGKKVYQPSPLGFYPFVLPEEMIYDLTADTDFKAAMHNAADLARGLSPWEGNAWLYRGALLIQADPDVFTLTDLGYNNYKIATGVIFGADAYVLGFGKPNRGEIVEFYYDKDDYARKLGLRVSLYFGGGVLWKKRARLVKASCSILT